MSRSDPTDVELAAIVAAVELSWPRPVVVEERKPETPAWRWSGRWWTQPIPMRRQRPWR